jgi:hypothetical protein
MEEQKDWIRAAERTWVVRFPRQTLATFGSTSIAYYVVTEPIFQDMQPDSREGVVRTGKVLAERPTIVTPTYAASLEGFSSDAYEYLRHLSFEYGPNSPGIMYRYRNEAEKMDIVSGEPNEIAHRISDDLERREENLAVVMVGVDEFWDVALLKFIYEFTASSAAQNVQDFRSKGLLEPQPRQGGAPRAAIQQIERLFQEIDRGGSPDALKRELDLWGLFEYYEDRFLNLFRYR